MQKVVFDSSFLIAVMERPTTWYEDMLELVGSFEPIILESVQAELSRLSSRRDKRGRFAALAADLAERRMLAVKQCGGDKPDDDIISYASAERAFVATVDSELIEQLRALRVSVISLRRGRVAII